MGIIRVYIVKGLGRGLKQLPDGQWELSNCNPNLERDAKVGDWILGMGGKALGGREGNHKIIYAMRVESNNGSAPRSSECCLFGQGSEVDVPEEIERFGNVPTLRSGYAKVTDPRIISAFESYLRAKTTGPAKGLGDTLKGRCTRFPRKE